MSITREEATARGILPATCGDCGNFIYDGDGAGRCLDECSLGDLVWRDEPPPDDCGILIDPPC